MCKYALAAAFLMFALTSSVRAEGPAISPADDAAEPQADAVMSDVIETPSVPMGATTIVEHPAYTSCECQDAAPCEPCGSSTLHLTCREKCAYYRSVRQSFDRGPCCADYFGGFGPLWDSYCCDKQRGCGTAACAPCRSCRPLRGARARFHAHATCGGACCEAAPGCDCAGPAPMLPLAEEQQEEAVPMQPAETEVPETSATSSSPKFSPTATSRKSSRRSWQNRTTQWRQSR